MPQTTIRFDDGLTRPQPNLANLFKLSKDTPEEDSQSDAKAKIVAAEPEEEVDRGEKKSRKRKRKEGKSKSKSKNKDKDKDEKEEPADGEESAIATEAATENGAAAVEDGGQKPKTATETAAPPAGIGRRERKRLEWEAKIAARRAAGDEAPPKTERPNGAPHKRKLSDASTAGHSKKHKPSGENAIPLGKNARSRPQQSGPRDLPLLNGETHSQLKVKANRLRTEREKLPIWKAQDGIRECLTERDVLVLAAQTGTGKSTQLGQFLLRESWMQRKPIEIDGKNVMTGGCIAITQPRKVAATNLARRVAAEFGCALGSQVGYSVRFDNRAGKDTKLKFLTDGMLLQEMLRDPLLTKYSCIVVDEAHERSVNSDLCMGFLKRLVYGDRRGSLKVVIMSATLDAEAVVRFFEESGGEGVIGVDKDGNPAEKPADDEESEPAQPLETEDPAQLADEPERSKKKKKKKKAYTDALLKGYTEPDPDAEKAERAETAVNSNLTLVKAPGEPKPDVVYFGTVAILDVPGRQYPVEVFSAPAHFNDYIDGAFRTVMQLHQSEAMPADILVFLSGQEDIDSLSRMLEAAAETPTPGTPHLLVLPLYGAMPPHLQERAFQPAPRPNTRKIIISTNIAETSVTVPGVRIVIDSGVQKTKHFRHRLGMESLLITPIAKASALQRKGRAGREAPGKCYRLYTEEAFDNLEENATPEILRMDLSSAILTLKARGVEDVINFPWLSRPSRESLLKALEHLFALGALVTTGAISPLGRQMSQLPLPPALSRVLLSAATDHHVPAEAIDIIAALTVENLLQVPQSDEKREQMMEARTAFQHQSGDHIFLLNLVRAFDSEPAAERKDFCNRVAVSFRGMGFFQQVRKQLRSMCARFLGEGQKLEALEITPDVAERVVKAFLRGFVGYTARRAPDGTYRTIVGSQTMQIHPASTIWGDKRPCIVFCEYVYTTKAFARTCSEVEETWVEEAGRGWLSPAVE